MTTAVASTLVTLAGIYFGAGLLFGLWFVIAGVGRVDPVARQGSPGFRALILPGVAALWPLFASRLLRGVAVPPDEHTPHRDQAAGGRP